MSETMRIVELRAENFKRLSAVRIKPDGSLVRITGRNGQGKSSVLDSIVAALGGGKHEPDLPIRKGAKKAEVEIDLGTMTIEWSRTSGGKSLKVTPKDGSPLASPQAVLDKLVGDLTFDPLAFSRMKPGEQVEALKRITGLGEQFDKLDKQRREAYDERTIVGRTVKQLEGQLAGLPPVNGPDAEVSVSDLIAERDRLAGIKRENDRHRTELDQQRNRVRSYRDEVEKLQDQLQDLKANLESESITLTKLEDAVQGLTDPDIATADSKVANAEHENQIARQRKARAHVAKELKAAQEQYDAFTRQVDKADEAKRAALESAKMPVAGLAFADEQVTLNGIPLSCASASEKLRIGVAMCLAENRPIRIALIHDGSLLDDDAMAELGKLADEHQLQVWIERVANDGEIGVVIEDGEVVEADAPQEMFTK